MPDTAVSCLICMQPAPCSSFDTWNCRALLLRRPLWAPMCLSSTLDSTLQSSGRWVKVLSTLCTLPNVCSSRVLMKGLYVTGGHI